MRRLKEISKEKKRLIDTDNSMVIARGKGVEEVEEGKGGINGDGRPDLGWKTHNTIYR